MTSRRAFVAVREALSLHATLEEGVFYPAVTTVPDAETLHEVSVAVEHHGAVKGLLAEIDATGPSSPSFLAKCLALRDVVSLHVKDEETRVFPQAVARVVRGIARQTQFPAVARRLRRALHE
jgi:hypothetical protein